IEHAPLFKQYNYAYIASSSSPYGISLGPNPNPNPNNAVAAQLVPSYVRPSDENPPPVETRNPGVSTDFYEMVSVRRSNYLFSTGAYTDYDADWSKTNGAARGAFGNNGATSVGRVKDGTSNTIGI